jgi:hypothetical protein
MKRALFTLLAAGLIAGTAGCAHDQMHGSCPQNCDPRLGHSTGAPDVFAPGPPTGAITYPYYTVRGPRDFLASDPRPVGP